MVAGAFLLISLRTASVCDSVRHWLLARPGAAHSFRRPLQVARSRKSPSPTVHLTADYKKAASLYRAGKHAEAEQILTKMLDSGVYQDADRDFLIKQRHQCQQAAGTPAIEAATPTNSPHGMCGPNALAIALARLNVKADVDTLEKHAGRTPRGTSLQGLARAAKRYDAIAEGIQVNRAALRELDCPAVVWWNGNHFVALLGIDKDKAEIHDPNNDEAIWVDIDEVIRRSGGIILTLRKQEARKP